MIANRHSVFLWAMVLWCLLGLATSFADSVHYLYDDAGRLRAVIDSSGNEKLYIYDEVGNLLSVGERDLSGLSIAITDFEPKEGVAGTTVTLYGKGFDAVPENNSVTFNGLPAAVQSASDSMLVVTAPTGVSTGRIGVIDANGSATSAEDFVVRLPIQDLVIEPGGMVFLLPKESLTFKAFSNGMENKRVRWSVEAAGPKASGSISIFGGWYVAPEMLPGSGSIDVIVTSLDDPSITARTNVVVNIPTSLNPVSVAFAVPSEPSIVLSPQVSVFIASVPDGTGVVAEPVNIRFPSVTDGLVTSPAVSVSIASVPDGAKMVAAPLNVRFLTVADARLVSSAVSVGFSLPQIGGVYFSRPVNVKMLTN